MMCDRCTANAVWLVFAAYSVPGRLGHPHVAHYPAPMARLCTDHLPVVMADDMGKPGSTCEFVVSPVIISRFGGG